MTVQVVTVVLLMGSIQHVEMMVVISILPGTQEQTVMVNGPQMVTKVSTPVVVMTIGITTVMDP